MSVDLDALGRLAHGYALPKEFYLAISELKEAREEIDRLRRLNNEAALRHFKHQKEIYQERDQLMAALKEVRERVSALERHAERFERELNKGLERFGLVFSVKKTVDGLPYSEIMPIRKEVEICHCCKKPIVGEHTLWPPGPGPIAPLGVGCFKCAYEFMMKKLKAIESEGETVEELIENLDLKPGQSQDFFAANHYIVIGKPMGEGGSQQTLRAALRALLGKIGGGR